MLKRIIELIKIREVRSKLFFTLFILAIFRLLTAVTIPGVNLKLFKEVVANSDVLQIFNMFSGGAFARLSILTVGLGPYINASYILQLLSAVFPSIKELYTGGPIERKMLTVYTRLLSVPLAIGQSIAVYFGLTTLGSKLGVSSLKFITVHSGLDVIAIIAILTFGAIFTMWLGELISEYGLGGGSSIIILAGILVSLPTSLHYAWGVLYSDITKFIFVLALAIILILAVILALAYYKVPVIYAHRVRASGLSGQENYMPIPINPAGVMPVIFAISIVRIPAALSSFFVAQHRWPSLAHVAATLNYFLNNFWYSNILILLTTVGFTVFSAFLVFRPKEVAENLAKSGGFVKGVRPGRSTEEYLRRVLVGSVVWGAVLLGVLVLLPNIMVMLLKLPTLVVTGTGVLIIASVVMDIVRQVEALHATFAEPIQYF